MIVFWALVILGVVFLIRLVMDRGRAFQGGRGAPPPAETPLDILKKRYARGEITREEFESMKRDLR